MRDIPKNKIVVFFDGVCNFCSESVNFIIKRDKQDKFVFAPLQSQIGTKVLKDNNMSTEKYETMLVVKDGKILKKSAAALEISKYLAFPWPALYVFKVVPFFIRDLFYDLVSKNRYRFFGQAEACMLPTPEVRNKFLEMN